MVSGPTPVTRVSRSFSFEAAHQLPWHPGRCRRLHGHHYRLEVSTEGPLDERGVRPVAMRLFETPETWVELSCPHPQRAEGADGR